MKYNPDIHNRRSIRLKGYDYSQAGAYFVTICVQHRKCLFGDVVDGKMILNDAGQMVQTVWDEIPHKYPGVQTNGFVVMPNHIHGIIGLVGAAPCGRPDDGHPQGGTIGHPRGGAMGHPRGGAMGHPQGGAMGHPRGGAPTVSLSLSDVVQRFKTLTTKRYAEGVCNRGWPLFPGKLWQRNYYEHIIRDENDSNRIREYIADNPSKWEWDRYHPLVER